MKSSTQTKSKQKTEALEPIITHGIGVTRKAVKISNQHIFMPRKVSILLNSMQRMNTIVLIHFHKILSFSSIYNIIFPMPFHQTKMEKTNRFTSMAYLMNLQVMKSLTAGVKNYLKHLTMPPGMEPIKTAIAKQMFIFIKLKLYQKKAS